MQDEARINWKGDPLVVVEETQVYIHTHIHTHTHIYIYIYICILSVSKKSISFPHLIT